MNHRQKYLSCLLGIAALVGGASPAFAAAPSVPSLGSAGDFAVLSAPSGSATGTAAQGTAAAAGAVTCTTSSITGDVGSTDPADTVAATCIITEGAFIAPVTTGVLRDFYAAYDALAPKTGDCDATHTLGSTIPSSTTLSPGTYCTTAALTVPDVGVTLTLDGAGVYIFKIGTSGTGALTGTNFNVALINGASACDVTWWVAQAATMTNNSAGASEFKGTILAGAAIDMTGTSTAIPLPVTGRALAGRTSATAGVTLTDVAFVGCEGSSRGGKSQSKCNQGVGNGPEGCDPGNSNQDGHNSNPFIDSERTNDELGGTPGDPGRLGN
jgi:hypothetical protein